MFLPTIYWQDGKRTKQYLEMLVDDLMTEYNVTHQTSNQGSMELGGNAGKILAKYHRDSGSQHQIEGQIKKSNASLFKDLYTILESQNMIQTLVGFDDDIWNQLKTGEFLLITGEFKQSPAELVLSSMFDVVEQFKGFLEVASTQDQIQKIELASNIFRYKKVTMLIEPYIEGDHKFFTSLDSNNFVEDKYDLEGEFTILAKIKRVFQPNQKVDLMKLLPGKLRMKKEQLLTILPTLDNENLSFDVGEINEDSFEIKGPAIELTPIAIYQE